MKKSLCSLFIISLLFHRDAFPASKTWVAIHQSNPSKCSPVYHEVSPNISEIEINLPGFFVEEKSTPRGTAYSVSIPGGARMLRAGLPDLSQLTFSLIIPGNAEMKADVVYSAYTDYHYSLAPSKGNLKRDQNPADIPYAYDGIYSVDAYYPAVLTSLRDPYILRDVRGQTVVVYPFHYNPVSQTLRVYHSLKLIVSPTGNPGVKNVMQRARPLQAVDATFASVYKTHFLNAGTLTYSPLFEHGNMLVLADPALIASIQPFVDWKNRMGQPTEVVDVSSIGTDPLDIKDYIENYFNTNGLTFVLLVGDGPQIPPYPSPYGDSDPAYGYILGNDSYAEVIVGRFSANDTTELETQVQRTLNYEMYPDPNGQWYHKAVCIGSDQGPGDDNEMDFEHERNIGTDYLGYTYTLVDELYDGSQGGADMPGDPGASDLNAALNDGRSVVTYTGHGSSTSLGTTGYGVSDVANLTNFDELPFIWSVACVNGDFNYGTCLAEALMRATSPTGKATGAIATLMSTINQSWDPPMDGQDEMVDLLVESYPGNIKHTFGGLSVNGCMHMNDQYGPDGDEMTDTWNLFGDPSLMVRTNTPAPLVVSHASLLDVSQSAFTVFCPTNGALVCLSHNNQIVTTGWTLMGSAILLPSGLHIGDTLDLVVTAYNAMPYFSQVVVTASTTGMVAPAAHAFSIFPNPASGVVTLSLPANYENASVQIVNALGKTVGLTAAKNHTIDVSTLAAGVYSVIVFSEADVLGTSRLVIKK
jgi:hypothetical protein